MEKLTADERDEVVVALRSYADRLEREAQVVDIDDDGRFIPNRVDNLHALADKILGGA